MTNNARRLRLSALAPSALAAMALACAIGCQPQNPPSTLGASFNVRTEQGWTGRRYTDNQFILAEEYDTNGDGRLDLWRFYSRGHLVAEERDLTGNGRVDYVAAWEGANRRLLSAARDADGRGVFDLQIEASRTAGGLGQWRITEDRDRDGFADAILVVSGELALFSDLGIDLATVTDLSASIPVRYWRERRVADGYGNLGAYLRYSGGQPTAYAAVVDQNGLPSQWITLPPDADPTAIPVPVSPEQYRAQRIAARNQTGSGAGAGTGTTGAAGATIPSGTGTTGTATWTDADAGFPAGADYPSSSGASGTSRAAGRRGGAGTAASTPVPSSAVDRALQRRREGPGSLEHSAALAYPTSMRMQNY